MTPTNRTIAEYNTRLPIEHIMASYPENAPVFCQPGDGSDGPGDDDPGYGSGDYTYPGGNGGNGPLSMQATPPAPKPKPWRSKMRYDTLPSAQQAIYRLPRGDDADEPTDARTYETRKFDI